MGEIVNLNQERKARTKAATKAKAGENRTLFGRTKAERETAAKMRTDAARDLDGKKHDR